MAATFTTASLLQIVFITLVLGCSCAWLMGRAIALTWRPRALVLAAAIPMALAVRFVHFALFEEPLLAPVTTLVETAALMGTAMLAFQRTRALQLVRQYPWAYERNGPLGSRLRQDAPPGVLPDR